MRRPPFLLLVCSILVGWGSSAARVSAQTAPLTVAYGNGVHAFFGGDFQSGYDTLSGVIEAGSTDPRAYYFRGLAALKLGRLDEAEADFQEGARLEVAGRGSVGGRAIGRALERVQGCDRLKLEQYRGRARVAALERDQGAIRRRYSDIEEPEADVLRRRRPERIEPAEPVAAPKPEVEAVEVEAVEDGADAGARKSAAPPPPPPRAEAKAEPQPPGGSPDPFADEPAGGK